jgi:hypothetical protein
MGQFTEGMEVYGCDVVGTSTGSTAIFTAPNGFVVSQIQVVSTDISALITAPTFSIGTNSSSYNNICGLEILTALPIVNNVLNISGSNPAYHIQTGDTVYINVHIAAIATTYDFQVILIGYPL